VLTVRIRKLANEAFQLEVKKQVPAFQPDIQDISSRFMAIVEC